MKESHEKINKILIIDDELFNIDALMLILEYHAGISDIEDISSTASSGNEAINLIKKNLEDNKGEYSNYNLILIDLNMPIMDGKTTSKEIREYLLS